MRRWKTIISLTLAVVGVGVAIVLALSNRTIGQESNEGYWPVPDRVWRKISDAMDRLGYPGGYAYDPWSNEKCSHLYALVFPEKSQAPVRFLAIDNTTGKVSTLTAEYVERELHHHINYQGYLDNGNLYINGKKMYFLGFRLDDQDTGVYIHLNRNACGLAVDQVLYRSPWETKSVPVEIQLSP